MKSGKLGIVLTVVTALVSSGIGYILLVNSPGETGATSAKRVEIIVDCIKSTAADTTGSTISDAAVETCLSTAAGQPGTVDETLLMLDKLTGLAEADDHIRTYCHDILHELGRAAWKVGGLDVFTGGHGSCGFGYYHGAMFEALTKDSKGDVFSGLTAFCQSYAADSTGASQTEWYLCMHGIGHAVASMSNSLTDAETQCGKISTTDFSAVAACFSGVLNEEFTGREATKQQPGKAVGSCTMNDESLRGVCYKYSLNYSGSSSNEIADFCVTLEDGPTQRGCWAGVGMRAGSTELFADPTSPGFTIATEPEATAAVINDACLRNTSIHCDTSLLNEMSQRVLNYDSILAVCELLSTEPRKNNCRSLAEQQRPVLLKS